MFANAQKLLSVAIASGGVNYQVNDVVIINDVGTCRVKAHEKAVLQVTAVNAGGVVTGLSILSYGGWLTDPATPNSPWGGSGSGLSLNLTFQLYWDNVPWIVPNSSGLQSMMDLIVQAPASVLLGGLASIAVASGGSGYVVGDVVSVAGGTLLSGAAAATISVDAVNGSGAITAAHILTFGGWTIQPSTPNNVTGGTGANATFNLTFNAPINRADKVIAMAVNQLRGAIQNGRRIPLSVTAGAIPPSAEPICYALALKMMLPALPTLVGLATNPPHTSGKNPLAQAFDDARDWLARVTKGESVEYPSDPNPSFECPVDYGSSNPPVDLRTLNWHDRWDGQIAEEIGQP